MSQLVSGSRSELGKSDTRSMAIPQNLNSGGNLWELPPIGEGSIHVRSNTITYMSVVHICSEELGVRLWREKIALSVRATLKPVRMKTNLIIYGNKCILNLLWFMNGLILFDVLIIREPLNHQFSSIQLSKCSCSNLTIKFFLAWSYRPLVRWMAARIFICRTAGNPNCCPILC